MAKDLHQRRCVLDLDEVTRLLLPQDAQPHADQVAIRIREGARDPPRELDFATFGDAIILEWMEENALPAPLPSPPPPSPKKTLPS